ncbi:MAG: alpha/beta hydrolase [Caldilineaceae bacterium]
MKHSESTVASADGTVLYSQSWKADAQKAVIALVHGFGEHGGRYNYLVDALVPQGYSIYAIDLRGHGRSPGKRGHVNQWQEFDQDVAALLKWVKTNEPAAPIFLMGHSMGGLIVLHYVEQQPEGLKGVIASAPFLAAAKLSPLLAIASKVLLKIKPDMNVSTGLDVNTISRDQQEVARYATDKLVHGLGTPKLDVESRAAIERTHANAGKIQLPILLYHGTGDHLVPIAGTRRLAAALTVKDKTFIEYPDGAHESHNDLHRAQVFADLVGWLDRHI